MLTESVFKTNPDLQKRLHSQVKTAARADRSHVVDVIMLAFSTDPVARWAYPNPQQYMEYFPNFIRIFGGKAFEANSAYYVDEFSAAALWLPPDVGPDEEALTALFKNTVSCKIQDELFYVFEEMGNYHPKDRHWYLPMIGADPVQQGKGYGSTLLKHALDVCDADKMPAYLESSNPKNIPLYERFGFELMGTIQVGSSPPLFPMLRESRAAIS